MTSLVPPHGGLTEPVCRTVAADAIDGFLAHAKTLPQVPVSDADLSTVYRLGDGGLSPLDRADGFGHVQSRARRVGHRTQRQALRLDDPAGPARDRVARQAASAGPAGGAGRFGGQYRRRAGHHRHLTRGTRRSISAASI